MDAATFLTVLTVCQSAKAKEERDAAEKAYFETRQTQPKLYVETMMQVISQMGPQSGFAAILFRRDVESNGSSSALMRLEDPAAAHHYMVDILNLMSTHPQSTILRFLADIIGVYCENVFPDGRHFPELEAALRQAFGSQSDVPTLRTALLSALSYICQFPLNVIRRFNYDLVLDVLDKGLRDPHDEVAVAAIECLTNMVIYNTDIDEAEENAAAAQAAGHAGAAEKSEVLPPNVVSTMVKKIIERIFQMLQRGSPVTTCENALKSLVDLVDINGDSLVPHLKQVVDLVQNILASQLDDSLKKLAVAIFAYLCENVQGIKKRARVLIQEILRTYIIPLVGAVDDLDMDEWLAAADPEELDDSNSLRGYCSDALDRISQAIGRAVVYPVVQDYAKFVLSQPSPADWHIALALLDSIALTAEGFARSIKVEEITFLTDVTLSFAQHPHPRVRYAVINTIGQISEDFQPRLQKRHAVILPVFFELARDPCTRVAAHVPAALVNFIEPMELEDLYPYIAQLSDVISLHLEQSQDLVGNSNALTLIAVLSANLEKSDFTPICTRFMPNVLQRFQIAMQALQAASARGKDTVATSFSSAHIKFLSRIIECISLAAESTPELFESSVDGLISSMLSVYDYALDDDEHSLSKFTLFAISRIATAYPDRFNMYLGRLMPILFQILNQSYLEYDQETVSGDDEAGIQFNPHVIHQQTVSLSAIARIMGNRPADFAPYLDDLLKVIQAKNFLTSTLSEYLRYCAIDCVSLCLSVVVDANAAAGSEGVAPGHSVQEMHEQIFKLLLDAQDSGALDCEGCTSFADSMVQYIESYCKYVANTNDMSSFQETMTKFAEVLSKLMTSANNSVKEYLQYATSPDADDEERKELAAELKDYMESYTGTITSVSDCYSVAIQTLKGLSTGWVEGLVLPVVKEWLGHGIGDEVSVCFTTSAISILADIVESIPVASGLPLVQPFIPGLVQYTDVHTEFLSVAHICFFTCGEIFEFYDCQAIVEGAPTLVRNAQEIITLVQTSQKGDEQALNTYDNAITMLSKMALRHTDLITQLAEGDLPGFWRYWLQAAQSVRTDQAEVLTCIKTLVSNFLANNSCFLEANLPVAVKTLVCLFFGQNYTGIVENKDNAELLSNLRQIFTQLASAGTVVQDAVATSSDYVKRNFEAYSRQ